jgi:hypothetical protein
MAEEIRADESVEGEYTDSELPADAALPKDADDAVNDGDWDGAGGDVVVEEGDAVLVEEEGEYTDTDFDADGRPERA